MKKLITILIFLTILTSCANKKSITKESQIERDSLVIDTVKVFKEVEREITRPIEVNYELPDLCDSITGKIKPFKHEIKSGGSNILLEADNDGNLLLSGYMDSIVNQKEKIKELQRKLNIKRDKTVKVKEIEIIRNVTPLWMWIVIAIMGLIIFLLIRF